MEVILDFEKPIVELEARISETKRLAEQNGLDISESLTLLEARLEQLRKDIYQNLSPWQRVQLARHPARPYSLDYIHAICDDFIELHGDRCGGDDKAIVAGVARIGPHGVIIIGQQKGRDTKTRQMRNFGMPNPEGYRKARRLMKLAEKMRKPVITLIDTPGAHPGMHAEEFGQAEAIARNLYEMAQLTVPILVFIIGEGASGGALGIGVGDKIYMLENSWYSVISPESCASILWRSWEFKEKAAEALHLSAQDNLKLNCIDEIIPEPLGGAHKNPTEVFRRVREKILTDLPPLLALSPQELVTRRLEKYSAMGSWIEKPKTA
ncbi:MAG: acetyl-CoA carboxylase carboxyltransferase subunit alpha [Bacteroidia bacterium]|nr:acetyl-CoA carboxylase carboxyltransferase subunit alpha [Bacteroidia bacterium]MCX7652846.1 acetyl-CoA carboxylase carboxyltransferase subunit alpha [Bacteroidia bacterium]MDW8417594.1 acetyl-CoA carboxylase carboxyltransferase subunit alpha [Bacteroidia bacterium]